MVYVISYCLGLGHTHTHTHTDITTFRLRADLVKITGRNRSAAVYTRNNDKQKYCMSNKNAIEKY